MYRVGRSIQFAGLVIVPFAVLMELQGALTLRQSLTVSAFGVVLFCLGYTVGGLGGK